MGHDNFLRELSGHLCLQQGALQMMIQECFAVRPGINGKNYQSCMNNITV